MLSGPAWANVKDYGAVGDQTHDDTDAIMAASAAVGHYGTVVFPSSNASYRHTAQLEVLFNGQRWIGGSGAFSSGPYLYYDGPASSSLSQVHVGAGGDGFQMYGFNFFANDKAGICLHIEGPAAGSMHHPSVADCHFQRYTSRGLVLGKNHLTDVCVVQFQMCNLSNLSWGGGAAPGAIGFLLNAQNAEFVNAYGLYFDPDVGREHSHHVWHASGGLNIHGLLTTRSTAAALHVLNQLLVTGWRAEDTRLISSTTAELSGPCHVVGIEHRPDGTPPAAGDPTIDWAPVGRPAYFQGSIYGSLRVGGTDARLVDADLLFRNGGGFVFTGPQNQRGLTRDVDTGAAALRGTAPAVTGLTEAGVQQWRVGTYLELPEITSPGLAPSNSGRAYFEDNGSGKTRLMVQFPTGAAQQLAIEV